MTPNEKGAFCSKCSKTVIDFTEKSPEEISLLLTANSGKKLCGRFMSDQLEEPIIPQIDLSKSLITNGTLRLRTFAIALFVVFGTTLFSCSTYTDTHTMGDVYIDTSISGTQATAPEDGRMMLGEVNVVPLCTSDSLKTVLPHQEKKPLLGKIKVVRE